VGCSRERPGAAFQTPRCRLEHDPRQTAEDRREGEAVVNARRRLALLAETVGTRHAEFATGLNQLALLLIMKGDSGSAEPLLRQALEVRRQTLGEGHPDYATNLSSLGGLLWARGVLDEAAPLLKSAAAIRVASLGPEHPKSVASLHSVEQLDQA
jgi:Tetratricopeptide repeat